MNTSLFPHSERLNCNKHILVILNLLSVSISLPLISYIIAEICMMTTSFVYCCAETTKRRTEPHFKETCLYCTFHSDSTQKKDWQTAAPVTAYSLLCHNTHQCQLSSSGHLKNKNIYKYLLKVNSLNYFLSNDNVSSCLD